MTRQNLGLDGLKVWTIAFQPGSARLWFGEGGTYLEVAGVWNLTLPDGSSIDYVTQLAGRDPATPQLIDALAGSRIVSAEAEIESSILDVRFENGVHLHFEPTDGPGEEWEAKNGDGRVYIALPDNELTWVEDDRPPFPPEPEWFAGADARLIDLEIAEEVLRVTLSDHNVELQTPKSSLLIAGPLTLTTSDGRTIEYDPATRGARGSTDALLDHLLNNAISLATIVPETSELAVNFNDGSRLDWLPSSDKPDQFCARNHDGRDFWRASGSVAWFGGPKGSYPKFLVGGPRASESIHPKQTR